MTSWAGIRPFQKEGGAAMVADQPGDFLPCCQIAAQVTQHRPDKMFALDGMFRGGDASRAGIDLGGERLGCIVEQGREEEERPLPWREARPLVEPWQFGADHLRMGPDIPFGMPPAVLLAVGHRSTPRLVACPRHDLFEGCLG